MDNSSLCQFELHLEELAEQKEQWKKEVVEEESRTRRKASQASRDAQLSLQAIDETLHDEQSTHAKVTKIMNKLERTCIRKQKEAIAIREQELKEEERKRLFLGLHIDRRPEHMKRPRIDEARLLRTI